MSLNQNWQDAAYLFLILLPVLDGLRDGETMATNARIYHKLGYLVRAITAVLLLWKTPILIPIYAAYFWWIFDLSWNITAHKSPFYVGSTAQLDKLFAAKIYLAKGVLLVASIVLLLLNYKVI